MRAIIYTRVSTTDQREHGSSLQAQKMACELYLKNFTLNKKLFFEEVVSGGADIIERPQLMQALLTLKKGDLFVAYSRDRLARDITIIFSIEQTIQKSGAELIVVNENTIQEHSSFLLHTKLIDLFAEYERTVIKKRATLTAQENKKQNKRVGTLPFGYQVSHDNNMLLPHAHEQEIIAAALRLCKKGKSVAFITKTLNDQGYRSRNNTPFSQTQIYRMIKNKQASRVPSDLPMKSIIKDLYEQGISLKHIQKRLTEQGFLTRRGTLIQVSHIHRLAKRQGFERVSIKNTAVFGYKKTSDGLQKCAQEQAIIAIIKTMRSQGNSLQSIVNHLNALQYKNRAQNPFQLTQIVRIIKNNVV